MGNDKDLKDFTKPTAHKHKKKRRVFILCIDYPKDPALVHLAKWRHINLVDEYGSDKIEVEKMHTNNGSDALTHKSISISSLAHYLEWLKEGSLSDDEEPPILEIIHHGANPDEMETPENRTGKYLAEILSNFVKFEDFGYFEMNIISCFFARQNHEGISQLDQLCTELMNKGAKHFVCKGSTELLRYIKDPKQPPDNLEELDKELNNLNETIIELNMQLEELSIKVPQLKKAEDKAKNELDKLGKPTTPIGQKVLESLLDSRSKLYEEKVILSRRSSDKYNREILRKLEKDYASTCSEAFKKVENLDDLKAIKHYLQKNEEYYDKKFEHLIASSDLKEHINTKLEKAIECYNVLRDRFVASFDQISISKLLEKYPKIEIKEGLIFNSRGIITKDGRRKETDVSLPDDVGSDGNFKGTVWIATNPDKLKTGQDPELITLRTPEAVQEYREKNINASKKDVSSQSSTQTPNKNGI